MLNGTPAHSHDPAEQQTISTRYVYHPFCDLQTGEPLFLNCCNPTLVADFVRRISLSHVTQNEYAATEKYNGNDDIYLPHLILANPFIPEVSELFPTGGASYYDHVPFISDYGVMKDHDIRLADTIFGPLSQARVMWLGEIFEAYRWVKDPDTKQTIKSLFGFFLLLFFARGEVVPFVYSGGAKDPFHSPTILVNDLTDNQAVPPLVRIEKKEDLWKMKTRLAGASTTLCVPLSLVQRLGSEVTSKIVSQHPGDVNSSMRRGRELVAQLLAKVASLKQEQSE